MFILGISCFYHDSASCLINKGQIVAAAQEERFTRIKHDSSFPKKSIEYCLKEAKINFDQVEKIVFYEKPFLKFERLLETYLAFAPKGIRSFLSAMPLWIKEKLFQKTILIKELSKISNDSKYIKDKLLFCEHHLSHASSAFFPSPFEKAAILTLDGVGEWATTSISIGEKNKINLIKEINFPHSLGLLYSAFTYYTGFKVNSGEYKLMGLAPYGVPKFSNLIKENLIQLNDDGSFKLDMSYFDFATGLKMTNNKFHKLFGREPRKPEAKITQHEMDIAASIQKVTEEVVLEISKHVKEITGCDNLCLAGGVALNCVANGLLFSKKIFKNIWIQPAAGDAGGALGAALSIWHLYYLKERKIVNGKDKMYGSYLGPSFTNKEIENQLKSIGAIYDKYKREDLLKEVALLLSKEKAIGWMQGRMEFGPRALGARSIIADPRSPSMQRKLNLKIKYRESFRPFAPSVLRENLNDWFDCNVDSPYMLLVSGLKKDKQKKMSAKEEALFGIEKLNVARSSVPAITHIDYSARIQTVHKETNKMYYDLISEFKNITDCPLVVNTSFNVRGEPIVCTPKDAFNCFMGTELDVLVIENYLLIKEKQNPKLKSNYNKKYELD
ncbi:carbamoyltransferase [Pelagibacteraceae bacterium]|nr:carbamoyltransferase [Pelagibacteraceae bacterium]